MKTNIEQWLAHLPLADEQAGDGFVLTGRLVSVDGDEVRIVVGEPCLSFSPDDILDIAPVEVTEQLGPTPSPGTVRVAIRRGASLLDARPGTLIDGLPPPRRPFALATRPTPIILDPVPRFRELERRFLLSQSLIDA
jgi:hypothetical protein